MSIAAFGLILFFIIHDMFLHCTVLPGHLYQNVSYFHTYNSMSQWDSLAVTLVLNMVLGLICLEQLTVAPLLNQHIVSSNVTAVPVWASMSADCDTPWPLSCPPAWLCLSSLRRHLLSFTSQRIFLFPCILSYFLLPALCFPLILLCGLSSFQLYRPESAHLGSAVRIKL